MVKSQNDRSPGLVILVFLLLIAICIITALMILTEPETETGTGTIQDMDGKPVIYEGDEVPSNDELKAMDVKDVPSADFRVPSVGLSTGVKSLTEVHGHITPPGFVNAYYVRSRGTSLDTPEKGTVYVAVHSLRRGRGPGNYLYNEKTKAVRLQKGDEIIINNNVYRMVKGYHVNKNSLPTHPGLWDDTPGRLVVLTCLQREDGKKSTDNVVIEAEYVGPEAAASDNGK